MTCVTDDRGSEIRVTIPDALRVGHEAHFGQVTEEPAETTVSPPAWSRGVSFRTMTRAESLFRASARF